MTVVFVHGVPETAAVWDPLVAALTRSDIVQLGLPGFGSPLPEGFDATMHGYADWLAAELAKLGDIHLVGHDWGALLMLRVLGDQPANVRSWVVDAGDLDPTFVWHDTAKVWQTPGDGEALIEMFVGGAVADRAAILVDVGVPEAHAPAMAERIDATMGAAILSLYRSAVDIGTEWGPGIDHISGPGLIVGAAKDPFRAERRARRLAERTGATLLTLPEQGHFWMLEEPASVAAALESFWAEVDTASS